MVNCVGQPPVAGTSHRLLRPLMFEINATCWPSGDQVEPPIARVMYSFSIEKVCISGTVLLSSLVGSVIAGGVPADFCANAVRVIRRGITKSSFKFRVSSFERAGITGVF